MAVYLLVVLALLIWQERRERDGRLDAALWLLTAGVVGGRLVHVAVNWSFYAERPGEIIHLAAGGLSFQGAVLAGLLALALFARLTAGGDAPGRLSDLLGALIPLLALGLAAGWLACLWSGCAYGKALPPPQRFFTPDWPDLYGVQAFRLPSQLFGLALAGGLLAASRGLARRPGLFLALCGLGDFLIAFSRGDQQLALGPLWMIQWLDLLIVAAGLLLMVVRLTRSE